MPEPDYFDRLLARQRVGPAAGVARVRPRLPGPFERAEARWIEPELEPVSPLSRVPAPAASPIRTERHTETRTEPAGPVNQWITYPAQPESPGPGTRPSSGRETAPPD
ncbi:hypothetical protein, partial [Paractinoplanes durhamensis]